MGNWEFWQLAGRSDTEVLARLEGLVGSTRQLTAELVAHLGEVEERRLHLVAAHGSMFQYCTAKLGLSEDEACRRIDVARLARRFPVLFPALASGQLSLSVAALLKPYLSDANQVDLVKRLSGKSVRQAEETLAALFPRADVASSMRKLPSAAPVRVMLTPEEPGEVGAVVANAQAPGVTNGASLADAPSEVGAFVANAQASSVANCSGLGSAAGDVANSGSSTPSEGTLSPAISAPNNISIGPQERSESAVDAASLSEPLTGPTFASPRRGSKNRFEPLSAERYRVQFTASLALKDKLELARDLMRHANPNGDFAPIVERAIDLLLEQLMQRRFGKTRRVQREPAPSSTARRCATPTAPPRHEGFSTESTDQPMAPRTQPHLASPRTDPPALQGDMPTPPPDSASLPTSASAASTSEPSASIRAPSTSAPTPSTTAPAPGECSVSPSPPSDGIMPARRTSKPRSSRPERITNATRRAVVARDGLQCSWVDDQGHRCPSRAWLEYDHRQPRVKGGSSEAPNIRLFCRPHNQFAAEQAYGREHVEAFTRRAERATPTPPLKVRDSREPRWLAHGSSHRGPPAERSSDHEQAGVTLQMAALPFGGTTTTRDSPDGSALSRILVQPVSSDWKGGAAAAIVRTPWPVMSTSRPVE